MRLLTTYIKNYPSLTHRDFRLLWIGMFISLTGSKMQYVAVNWHMYITTESAISLGLLGLARFVPLFIFCLIGGAFADMYNRKRLVLYAQIALAVVTFIYTIAAITHNLTPNLMYILTIISAIADSFEKPSRQSLIPHLVPKELLLNAVSLNSIMFRSAKIIGPSIAGIIIAQSGILTIFWANLLSFIPVILAIIMMKNSGKVVGPKGTLSLSALREAFTFIRSQTILRATIILDFLNVFFATSTALMPIFAKDILHVGPEGLGLLYAAPSIGALIVAFTVAHKNIIKKQGKMLILSSIVYALATVLFGFSNIFYVSILALVIAGAGEMVCAIIRNTMRQLVTPDHLRGRVTAVALILMMGGPELGDVESGLAATMFGAQLAVISGGLITLVVTMAMAVKEPAVVAYDYLPNKNAP